MYYRIFVSLFRLLAAAMLLGAVIGCPAASAAILNTLRGFDDKEPGWSGALNGSYNASGGNTEQTGFSLSAQLQWLRGKERVRLLGAAKRTSSRGEETARAVTGHLRHNHRLTGRWSTLVFFQAQENPFQKLTSRSLVGLGVRLDLVDSDRLNLVTGAANMWEREKLVGEQDHTSGQRLSVYVSSQYQIRDDLYLDGLFFYQPSWDDFQDWRFFGNLVLNVDLAANLSLYSGLQVEHDEVPPVAVEKTDWETVTGLKVSF